MAISRFVQQGFKAAMVAMVAVGGVLANGMSPVRAAMLAEIAVVPAAVVERTVDCTAPVAVSRVYVWVEPTDTVEVTFSNCTHGWVVRNSGGSTVRTGANVSGKETLQASESIRFYDAAGSSGSRVIVYANPVYPETVPSGSRQLVSGLTIAADALQMNIGPAVPSGLFYHNLGGLGTCKLGLDTYGGNRYYNHHVYAVLPITVTMAGTYTFRGVSTSPASIYFDNAAPYNPISDPFLALYRGFDPTQPDMNIVGCNDDLDSLFDYGGKRMGERLPDGSIMDGHMPYFVAELQPGDYELVLTTYQPFSTEDWAEIGFGPASATFEMWGPSGSLCLREDACGGGGASPSFDLDLDHYRRRDAGTGALPNTK